MCTTIQCKEEDKNTFFLDNSIFMLSMDYFSYFAYWNYRIVQYFRYINIYNYSFHLRFPSYFLLPYMKIQLETEEL